MQGAQKMIYAGIDAGSRAVKVVLLDSDSLEIVGSGVRDQGVNSKEIASDLLDDLIHERGLHRADIARTVATGHARNLISDADMTITEISCHAAGVHRLMPSARTVIEMGGQDSKLLRLDERGVLYDFAMNDRCAAGTGRFLEIVADRFGVDIGSLGKMAAESTSPAAISSMCVVFAETEIIGLLASGMSCADIVAGVQNSVASRVAVMAGGKVIAPVAFTGGVAMIEGMDKALEAVLGSPVSIVPTPQMTGALGAAVLASSRRSPRP
jgi:(R)-2-hydroxyacyl-CoA dehydratese activating ATPase